MLSRMVWRTVCSWILPLLIVRGRSHLDHIDHVTLGSRSDPIGGSEPSLGRETIYWDSLSCSFSELTLVPVFSFICTIYVIKKKSFTFTL